MIVRSPVEDQALAAWVAAWLAAQAVRCRREAKSLILIRRCMIF